MTTTNCTVCHDRFHAFEADDDTCLSCLEKADAVSVEHVAPQSVVDMPALIAGVRKYASENYETGKGWDHVVECYSDEELAKLIGKCRTVNGAIWAVWNKAIRFVWQMNLDNRWLVEEREAERKAALADAVWAATEDAKLEAVR